MKKELLERFGVTAKELSEKTGIPLRTVYSHFHDGVAIGLEDALKYQKVIRCKMVDLIK